MKGRDLKFQNILVIDFGQLGDVVLSLPALKALRERFPDAKITVMAGKSPSYLLEVTGLADEVWMVDRVALRDGPRTRTIPEIFRLVGDVRRRRFDLVIDILSLWETNLLGFLSGAKYRLFADRERRSLNFLGRFPEPPPPYDISKHYTDKYLDVLRPLGIEGAPRFCEICPPEEQLTEARAILKEHGVGDEKLIGLFVGAGHPNRRWPLDSFAALAKRLVPEHKVLVLIGPEEAEMLDEIHEKFPPEAIVLDKLKLLPLFAVLSLLDVLVSNDTGPMHLGAASGSPVVLVLDERAPDVFLPLAPKLRVLRNSTIDQIGVDEVHSAVADLLDKGHD